MRQVEKKKTWIYKKGQWEYVITKYLFKCTECHRSLLFQDVIFKDANFLWAFVLYTRSACSQFEPVEDAWKHFLFLKLLLTFFHINNGWSYYAWGERVLHSQRIIIQLGSSSLALWSFFFYYHLLAHCFGFVSCNFRFTLTVLIGAVSSCSRQLF